MSSSSSSFDHSGDHEHHASLPAGTAPSTGAPLTTAHRAGEPDTVPTVSATGAPRVFGRHTEQRHQDQQRRRDERRRRGRRHQRLSSSGYDGNGEESDSDLDEDDFEDDEEEDDDDDEDEEDEAPAEMQPSGSLTVAALSPSSHLPISRRAGLLASALAINLGLPFINGIMLGLGEIVARTLLAPWLGVLLGPVLPWRFNFFAQTAAAAQMAHAQAELQQGLGTAGVGLHANRTQQAERRSPS